MATQTRTRHHSSHYIHCMEFAIQLNSINELIIERWVVLLDYTDIQIHFAM